MKKGIIRKQQISLLQFYKLIIRNAIYEFYTMDKIIFVIINGNAWKNSNFSKTYFKLFGNIDGKNI